MKTVYAKLAGWGQLVLAVIEQASNGHFPQNKTEWIHLFTSTLVALAVHHSSSTDGTK